MAAVHVPVTAVVAAQVVATATVKGDPVDGGNSVQELVAALAVGVEYPHSSVLVVVQGAVAGCQLLVSDVVGTQVVASPTM